MISIIKTCEPEFSSAHSFEADILVRKGESSSRLGDIAVMTKAVARRPNESMETDLHASTRAPPLSSGSLSRYQSQSNREWHCLGQAVLLCSASKLSTSLELFFSPGISSSLTFLPPRPPWLPQELYFGRLDLTVAQVGLSGDEGKLRG